MITPEWDIGGGRFKVESCAWLSATAIVICPFASRCCMSDLYNVRLTPFLSPFFVPTPYLLFLLSWIIGGCRRSLLVLILWPINDSGFVLGFGEFHDSIIFL